MPNTVTKHAAARNARFRAALLLEGLSQAAFAKRLGVSAPHVYYVVTGKRHSPRITRAIDDLIAKHTGGPQ